MNKKFDTRVIVLNALVAATYVVLNAISAPIAFGAIQFRIAEIMMLFPFFNKSYSIGVTLGCLIANLMSPFMLLKKNKNFFVQIRENQNLDYKF